MVKIEAIIRKSKYRVVRDALHEVGITFLSYWDVTGVGNEKEGHVYRGITYSTSDIQRRHISFVCREQFKEPAIEAILSSASTGNVGDGKIFVSPVTEAYRIRTKESGDEAVK